MDAKLQYEGQFEDDQPLGLGKIKYENGDVYIGQVEKYVRAGRGRLISKTWTFDGRFEKDLKDGTGFLLHNDGRIYCGEYKQGVEEGYGEFLTAESLKVDRMKLELKHSNQNALSAIED